MFQTINLSTITFSSCSCTAQFLEPSGCIYSYFLEWHVYFCARNLAVKTHNEVTPFYRHFEPSETFGTASHQVRNTTTGKVEACADVFPRCLYIYIRKSGMLMSMLIYIYQNPVCSLSMLIYVPKSSMLMLIYISKSGMLMSMLQWNEHNWSATSNQKFEAKRQGQSQSFCACKDRGQSINMNMYSWKPPWNLQKCFLTALKAFC
jgi:hypothetical protein